MVSGKISIQLAATSNYFTQTVWMNRVEACMHNKFMGLSSIRSFFHKVILLSFKYVQCVGGGGGRKLHCLCHLLLKSTIILL